MPVDDLEYELSKLKDKWAREFDSMSNFPQENIKSWTILDVNVNNDILDSISQGREELADKSRKVISSGSQGRLR